MTKQAEDLIKPRFKDMSDEEIREFIRSLRHRRSTPKKTEKKSTKKTAKDKALNLFQDLTPEEKARLLAELGGEET